MGRKFISIYTTTILVIAIIGCAQTADETPAAVQETNAEEMLMPEEIEAVDEESNIISSGWYKYFLEQQEYISNISNGQCSYEIIGEEECDSEVPRDTRSILIRKPQKYRTHILMPKYSGINILRIWTPM